jgi:spore coat protein CotH
MYNDFSLVKDRLAFGIADALETDVFVPSYNYVDLYINDSYVGIYLLTDQVDENSGRTDVKEDFSAEDTEVPFLVELDEYAYEEGDEDVAWFSVNGFSYTVKYPEPDERYNDAQFNYIKNYVEAVDNLVRKDGVTIAELSEYIDVESFIDFYIVQELMGQIELNWKSV